jgi:hypothetical protein
MHATPPLQNHKEVLFAEFTGVAIGVDRESQCGDRKVFRNAFRTPTIHTIVLFNPLREERCMKNNGEPPVAQPGAHKGDRSINGDREQNGD